MNHQTEQPVIPEKASEVSKLLQTANLLLNQGGFQLALQKAEPAIALAAAANQPALQAHGLFIKAQAEKMLGRIQAARDSLTQAEALCLPSDNLPKANILVAIGDIELMTGNQNAGKAALLKAQALFQQSHFLPGETQALIGLANLESQSGHNDLALQYYSQALTLCRQFNDKFIEANILFSQANLLAAMCDYQSARLAYQQARQLWQSFNNQHGEASVLCGLAELENLLGNDQEARTFYAQALDVFQQLNNPLGQANVISGLAELERKQSNYSVARRAYLQALSLYRQLKDIKGEANIFLGLGDLDSQLGNYYSAHQNFAQALSLYEQIGDTRKEADVLFGLGKLETQLGNSNAAAAAFTHANELYQSQANNLGKANVRLWQAHLQSDQRDYAEAEKLYLQARDLYQQLQDRLGEANAGKALADLLSKADKTTDARLFYQQAIELYQQINHAHGEALTLTDLGDLENAQGNLPEATAAYIKACRLHPTGEWWQAKLIEKIQLSLKLDEDNLCRQTGLSRVQLRSSQRALALVKQYLKSDYGDQFNETKFPLFVLALQQPALKDWLGWDDGTRIAANQANCELFFSWLSRLSSAPDKSNQQEQEAILKQPNDIAQLEKIVADDTALSQLKQTRSLSLALQNSALFLREQQQEALSSVITAIDKLKSLAIPSDYLPDLETALGHLQGLIDGLRSSGLSGVEQDKVFEQRIDQHFSSLQIQSYKKLQGLELQKLSRINLIAGLNNSGKTTLLEAIYLLTRQNDFAGLLEVVRRRGKLPEDHLIPSWFIKQIPAEIKIQGVFNHKTASVAISHFQETDESIDKSRYQATVEIAASYQDSHQESSTRIFKNRERQTKAGTIKLLSPIVFSSPFFLNESAHYALFYAKTVQAKALPRIEVFLRRAMLPSLNRITLIDDMRRFLVEDDKFAEAMDLSSYGEGLQRIFFMTLLFASAENGVILIDEFENAIHTELIAELAPFIYELAKIFNVQIFMTSHSKECIDAFVNNVQAADLDDFSFHALVDDAGDIKAREYDGRKYAKLLRIADVDLRKAQ